MLTMESKSRNSLPNAMPSNSAGVSRNPQDPASLDSTAQTSSANCGDWQEEVYQKIKSRKDLYYADLNEMFQNISFKLQQHDSLPQQPKIDQIEKLRVFKQMLERLMQVLQITKSNISRTHMDKLPSFEKQIVGLLNSNQPRKPAPPGQQAQNILPQSHSTYSQIPQAQLHDGGVNPQLQSLNFPGSVGTMQQNSVPSLQHGSVSSLSAVTAYQQNISSSLQPGSNLDPGQAGAPSSMQQVSLSSMQPNLANVPQQGNSVSLQPQSGVSLLQSNFNNLHPNSNMLQNQHLKQQHEQQLMQHMQNKHLIVSKMLKFCKLSEEDEASSRKGTKDHFFGLKKELMEFATFMQFYVKLITFMLLALVIVAMLK